MFEVLAALLALGAITRATRWAFPWLSLLTRPLIGLLRTAWRRIWFALWTGPVREHGIGLTLWFWYCLATVIGTLSIVVSGQWRELVALIPSGLIITFWWRLLRWWRLRRLRPRPLPWQQRNRYG